MIDRHTFFDHVRRAPANGHLSAEQVDGMGRILDEWDRRGLTDPRWLAYELATGWHETGTRMQPIREAGSAAYLRAKPYWPWIGMGLVQVTWKINGLKFGAKVPDDLLTWPVALRALFDGMIDGVFTSRKLRDYFGAKVDDPTNARRIINGTDRAALVAGYHLLFLTAIKAATGPSKAAATASSDEDDRAAADAANAAAILQEQTYREAALAIEADARKTSAPANGFWSRFLTALTRKAA